MTRLILFLISVLACVATAQTSDGINAPVSRSVAFTPDEADFTVIAAGSLDSTQQQVKQALQDAGLPNPTVVATGLGPDTSLRTAAAQVLYLATVTIPAGSARDAAKSLETLRTHLPAPVKSLQYSVVFHASQATVDAAWLVVLPQLLAEAQKLGQSLAAATGVKLGAIRSISDTAGSAPGGVYGLLTPVLRIGDFSAAPYPGNIIPSFLLGTPYSTGQYTFSLNVNFATAQ